MKNALILSILTLAMGCQSPTEENTENELPNIIWLMAEDISIDLECYGMKGVQTPNLNRLAEEGMRFDHCYVTNSICSPSRSAMLIGTHQVITNSHHHRSNRNVPLSEPFKPFTYWLRDKGYTTILGHHGVMNKGRKIDVNFKHEKLGEWDGVNSFGVFDKYDTFKTEDQPFFAQIQLAATHRGDWWDEVRAQSTDPVNPDSVELPPYMADHPIVRLDWAKYLDQMEFIDQEVGMIVKELREKQLDKNTVIIFIGDNGRCNIRGKGYLHDPGVHIPLIIYDPRVAGGEVRKEVVSATDITATILDYAEIDIPEYMTGKPIFSEDFDRKYVYAARDLWDEVEERSRTVTSSRWKYIRNDMPEVPFDAHQAYLEFYRPAVHVMRTLKVKGALSKTEQFFFNNTKPQEELYDLENDPHETNNLALNPEYSSVAEDMRKQLAEIEQAYLPVSDVYLPEHAGAVDALQYVKDNHPEEYQRMLVGEEIGFKRMTKLYKKSKK